MFRSSAFVCLFVCSFELALDFEIPDPVIGRTILCGSALAWRVRARRAEGGVQQGECSGAAAHTAAGGGRLVVQGVIASSVLCGRASTAPAGRTPNGVPTKRFARSVKRFASGLGLHSRGLG